MQEHEGWLKIAKEDLQVAKTLLKAEFFSAVTYHCQQSAEKALKGYLAFKKQEIAKTHDLTKLVGVCKNFDCDFEKLYDAIEFLNPFATKFRYPTEFDVPEVADAEYAVKQAEYVFKFVLKKVVRDNMGQVNIFDISE